MKKNQFAGTLGLAVSLIFSGSVYAGHDPHELRIALDNDVFVPGSRDQDYTAGVNIAYSGTDVDSSLFYIDKPLRVLENIVAFKHGEKDNYTIETGLYGFTPEDISQSEPNDDDRPYASILYLSSAHESVDEHSSIAWKSVLTVGVLGLDLFGSMQNRIHREVDSPRAQGWSNQISDGGELTARYQLSRQSALSVPVQNLEAKWTQQISLGYITEASVGVSARYGRMNSEWWKFSPELASYGEQRSGEVGSAGESYIFAGAALKARAYNVFLQGQFRNSDVTYSSDEINRILFDAWVGYSHSLGRGYQLSYTLRGQSSEVKSGGGDRNLLWGGFTLSKVWF